MQILYKQPEESQTGSLFCYGVHECYCKKLQLPQDGHNVTKKTHFHTGIEVHIIIDGTQEYQIASDRYILEKGCFLLIYPNVPHRILSSSPQAQKYSLIFQKENVPSGPCFFGAVPARICENLAFIAAEKALKREISGILIENSILEILVSIFRLTGIAEKPLPSQQDNNAIVSLAKQYIADNIELAPTVESVADYCHLSSKQLTRIFNLFEGISPGEYITCRRVRRAEQLLLDHTLTLKQISEQMGFGSEHYFNSFVRAHLGMPPGEYRKMHGK